MPSVSQYEVVDDSFFTEAAYKTTMLANLDCDTDTLWRILAAPEPWEEWLGLKNVTFTSPEPYGVGSTRTVQIANQTLNEKFIAWTPGERMAFFMESGSMPVRAMAEDYRLTATSTGTSRLAWTVALTGRPRLTSSPLGLGLHAAGNRGLKKLVTFVTEHGAEYA